MNEIKKKVDNLITRNFVITNCPEKVFQNFVTFCKAECNNNYSFGLKLLLDGMEGNVKEATLFQQYLELKQDIKVLEAQIEELSGRKEEPKKIKTMGSSNR